ncbi:MAG: hypothetical protein WCS71_09195 [Sphaerochaetaceae bacterium]
MQLDDICQAYEAQIRELIVAVAQLKQQVRTLQADNAEEGDDD